MLWAAPARNRLIVKRPLFSGRCGPDVGAYVAGRFGAPMAEIDLSQYETPIRLRNMQAEDIPHVIALAQRCFPGMRPWMPTQLASHLQHFPEGQFVVEVDGKVVGSSSSLRLDFDEYDDAHTFKEISAEGTISNHDPEGLDLYGIEVMVDPDYRSMKIGQRLYRARKDLARRLNLRGILIAGRIPAYAGEADAMTPEAYVEAVMRNERDDPVLWFQLRNGFLPRRVLKDYLPSDKESLGHAVLLEWANIEYRPARGSQTRSARPIRITVIQYQMRKVDSWEAFARQTEYFVDVASDQKSDFAVFPELLTTQLLSMRHERDPGKAIRNLPPYTEAYIRHFRGLAVRYNINIVGGSHIVERAGKLYNVAFLFRRDGTIDSQDKLHITPNERRWWGIHAGDGIKVFDTDSGKIAINLCYDVEFPELARLSVEKGARILFVPYCTEDRQGHLRVRYCAQARAVENQVYVVTAGTVGNLPETENMDVQYAQSAIFTPSDYAFPRDGIQAEADPNVETVIAGDLDLEALRRHRKRGSVNQWRDRRTDLYDLRAAQEAAQEPAGTR